MVLPADKGRASVVMDTDTYRAKMSTLIENGPYQLLNKDPTDRLTRKLSEKLLTLKRSGYLSEAFYNKIRPRHKQPPKIYGLPKISRADVPLRPIVSCVNTFAYDLSAYLANVSFNRKVRAHGDQFSPLTILDNEIMVSFDVESLFTNVPVDAAVQAALQKLENDLSLADCTTLNICHLFWFPMAILFLSCRNLPRPENQTTVPNPPTSSKLLRFYLMSKVCPNSFAVAHNFQVGDYAKISASTTKRRCRPS